jgi:hypothetical protein
MGLAAVSASFTFAQGTCDRACLRTTLDQYLNAVVKHDPAAAPLFVGFRQTENAVVVKLGEGLWKSATALGKVQRRYLDAVSGQAAYFGTLEVGERTAVVNARVRVENREITEVEWYVAHQGDAGMNGQAGGNLWNPENLAKSPPPERVVPQAQRVSRQALLAITNSYFDGITTHDGSVIMAHPGCVRLENGGAAPGGGRGGAPDCTAGLANINIQFVAARRYPVVDEEAQAVLAFAVFQRRPGAPQRRNAFAEWFFIDGGKIRTVYSAMFYPDHAQPVPNWAPYDGNWPLPSTSVPAPTAVSPAK